VREWTETHREGTDVGPVDWEHTWAKELPEGLRTALQEAEKNPNNFVYIPGDFSSYQIVAVCMYDGWPYWKPGPAVAYVGPLGCIEWQWFNGYGMRAGRVKRGRPWALGASPSEGADR
jgi:hypothetical protein